MWKRLILVKDNLEFVWKKAKKKALIQRAKHCTRAEREKKIRAFYVFYGIVPGYIYTHTTDSRKLRNCFSIKFGFTVSRGARAGKKVTQNSCPPFNPLSTSKNKSRRLDLHIEHCEFVIYINLISLLFRSLMFEMNFSSINEDSEISWKMCSMSRL